MIFNCLLWMAAECEPPSLISAGPLCRAIVSRVTIVTITDAGAANNNNHTNDARRRVRALRGMMLRVISPGRHGAIRLWRMCHTVSRSPVTWPGSSAIVILAISPGQSNNKIDYLDYPLGPGKIILFTRIIDDNAREKRLRWFRF